MMACRGCLGYLVKGFFICISGLIVSLPVLLVKVGKPTESSLICAIVASLGVPMTFMIQFNWSALSLPRNKG